MSIGWFTVEHVLFGPFFDNALYETARHDVISRMAADWHGSAGLVTHALQTPIFWLAVAGVVTAWFLYLKRPDLPEKIRTKFSGVYNLLDRKYYFDDLYINGFAAGGRRLGKFLWQKGDELIIDGILVNGTANTVGRYPLVVRSQQSIVLTTSAIFANGQPGGNGISNVDTVNGGPTGGLGGAPGVGGFRGGDGAFAPLTDANGQPILDGFGQFQFDPAKFDGLDGLPSYLAGGFSSGGPM